MNAVVSPYACVLIYQGTRNLGDAIQTAAVARLFPAVHGVFRDAASEHDCRAHPFVINGWLGDAAPGSGANCVFAGVHVGDRPGEQLAWMRSSGRVIGTRDPFTQHLLEANGIPAAMIGCATLTLPRYEGPRSGVVDVDSGQSAVGSGQEWGMGNDGMGNDGMDGLPREHIGDRPIHSPLIHSPFPPPPPTAFLTNRIPADMPWEEQWRLAIERLEVLRTAALVYTSRLHVALPCLAFGTPVVVRTAWYAKQPQVGRFSLLPWLGFRFDEPCTLDVTPWARRYVEFVGEQLGERQNAE